MARGYLAIFAAALLAAADPAFATTVTVIVADADGHPVQNAVVTLIGAPAPAASARLPNEKTIDQRNETFIPLVTIIPKGGRIVFANNDKVTHQVYSFSATQAIRDDARARPNRPKPLSSTKRASPQSAATSTTR